MLNATQKNDSIRGLFSEHRGRQSEGEEVREREEGNPVVSIYGGDNKLNQALLLLLAVSTSTAIAWLSVDYHCGFKVFANKSSGLFLYSILSLP